MFYEVNTQEIINESSGGGSINTSGMYSLKMDNVYVRVADNVRTVNVQYTLEGSTASGGVLFIPLDQKDGQRHFKASAFDKILQVCGITRIEGLVKKQVKRKSGEFLEDCIVQLEGKEVIMNVQASYYHNNKGEIAESFTIRNVFRKSDKACAKEILENKDFGSRYASELEVAEIVDYKKGISPDDVEAWKKAKYEAYKNGGSSSTTTSNITTSADSTASPFDI